MNFRYNNTRNMNNVSSEEKNILSRNQFILSLLLVVLIVLLFFIFSDRNEVGVLEDVAIITYMDVNADDILDRLPEGFPERVPVSDSTLTESYSTLVEGKYLQSSVVFNVKEAVVSVYESYETFLNFEGYSITDSYFSDRLISFSATNGDSALTIVASRDSQDDTETKVTITNVLNLDTSK